MKKRHATMIFLLMSIVTACSSGAGTTSPEPTPDISPTPIAPTPTQPGQAESPLPQQGESPLSPTKPPDKTPPPSQAESAEKIKEESAGYLAEELNVSREAIKVISIVPTEWPDASLGCPEPGGAYAQVVTPGYKVLLEVEGKRYEVHTDRAGGNIVLCDKELEAGPSAAIEYLSGELGISKEEINVLSVETRKWPDASLGCPESGKSYAQVVTEGYQVLLEAEGKTHELHTDKAGENVVICKNAIDPAPAAARKYLADDLGISTEEVNIKSVEPVEWSDASLGCPEPGKSYAQVVTPGYRILMEAEGRTYEVHTDELGNSVVICETES